jgi:hypothetical protein
MSRPAKPEEIDLDPNAWERFEQFVKDVARAGPKHRPSQGGKAGRSTSQRKRPKAEEAD